MVGLQRLKSMDVLFGSIMGFRDLPPGQLDDASEFNCIDVALHDTTF